MAKHILAFPEDMGPVEREINQSKYDRLTDRDVRSDHQILAGHIDKLNARLDALEATVGYEPTVAIIPSCKLGDNFDCTHCTCADCLARKPKEE